MFGQDLVGGCYAELEEKLETIYHAMQIVLISDIPQFDAVRPAYEAVYAADPLAQVYLSWMWLRGWFEMAPDVWVVLGVRADATSPYVAFLPLILRGPRILGLRPRQIV